MSFDVTALFHQLEGRDVPSAISAQTVSFAQGEAFFQLAAAKNARAIRLRQVFAEKGFSRVLLSANIDGFDCQIPGCTVGFLEKGFFADSDENLRANKRAFLDGAIVIVNNNDAGQHVPGYADFYAQCTNTIFVAWDWDNHHWLELSTFLAAHSDIYAPAHHENLYLLTRYNWLTSGPVYCSTVQWSRKLLTDSLPFLISTPRSNAPLGKHIPYAPFTFRNQVVSTLGQIYPSIGFSDRTFHQRTAMEKLEEWAAHKIHWISPVLNDVAIRIFDALCSGGIPLVPESMRFLPPIRDIDRDFVLFYTPHDIIDPRGLVDRAIQVFDRGGADQIVARHRYALENHHGDCSMRALHNMVVEKYSI